MKKLVTKKVVKQPRRLTHGLYKMSVIEKRVILRIIESLQKDINSIYKSGNLKVTNNLLGDKIIRIPTKSLMRDGSKHHQRLKVALAELPLRRVYLKCYDSKEGNYEVFTGFILQSKFFERNSVVELQISKDMLPIYLNIANGYTSYKLAIAFELSSINTIRIYELLCSWLTDSLDQEVFFEDLKQKLGLGNKYPNSAQFKKKVLEPAMKELSEKADVWFEIAKREDDKTGELKEAVMKDGKKIIGWKIKIFKRDDQSCATKSSLKSLPPTKKNETPQKQPSINPKKFAKSKEKYTQKIKNTASKRKTFSPYENN